MAGRAKKSDPEVATPPGPEIPPPEEPTGDRRRGGKKKDQGTITLWPVADIKIGQRFRTDLGDLDGLAESIRANGLLHPIVITLDGTLIAGLRRLEAFRLLGWERIPVTVVSSMEEAVDQIRAQQDENVRRKDWTALEAAAAREAMLPFFEAEAKARRKAGKSADGEAGGRGKKKNPRVDCAEVSRGQRAREEAAVGTGYSSTTLNAVDEIVAKAQAKPELYQPVVDKLKETNNVSAAVRKMKEIEGEHAEGGKSEPPVKTLRITYSSKEQLAEKLVKKLVKLWEELGRTTEVEVLRGLQHGANNKTDTENAAQEGGENQEEREPGPVLYDNPWDDPSYKIFRGGFWGVPADEPMSAAELTKETGLDESILIETAEKYEGEFDMEDIDGELHFRHKR